MMNLGEVKRHHNLQSHCLFHGNHKYVPEDLEKRNPRNQGSKLWTVSIQQTWASTFLIKTWLFTQEQQARICTFLTIRADFLVLPGFFVHQCSSSLIKAITCAASVLSYCLVLHLENFWWAVIYVMVLLRVRLEYGERTYSSDIWVDISCWSLSIFLFIFKKILLCLSAHLSLWLEMATKVCTGYTCNRSMKCARCRFLHCFAILVKWFVGMLIEPIWLRKHSVQS